MGPNSVPLFFELPDASWRLQDAFKIVLERFLLHFHVHVGQILNRKSMLNSDVVSRSFFQPLHVFVCPRLMKPLWFKMAFRAADLMFVLKPIHSFWSKDRHEPLMIFICFSFLRHKPWQLRGTPALLEMARILQQMQESGETTIRSLLQQLCVFTRKIPSMSSGMVRQMLYSKYKFHISN